MKDLLSFIRSKKAQKIPNLLPRERIALRLG